MNQIFSESKPIKRIDLKIDDKINESDQENDTKTGTSDLSESSAEHNGPTKIIKSCFKTKTKSYVEQQMSIILQSKMVQKYKPRYSKFSRCKSIEYMKNTPAKLLKYSKFQTKF